MNKLDFEEDMNLDQILDELSVATQSIDESVKELSDSGKEVGIKLHNKETDKAKAEKIFYGLTEMDRKQAVAEYLIPPSYKDAVFDIDKIKLNLIKMKIKNNGMYTIHKFDQYTNICTGILSAIRMRQLPDRSYLIGAPNGFGKTSFVTECLITLRRQSFRAVPYISLLELSYIRIADEQRLMEPFLHYRLQEDRIKDLTDYIVPNENKGIVKSPEVVTGRYSFSEYINADCLFVSLSGAVSKEVESNTLKQLLNIRGAKGLPTIVIMSDSLDIYKKDANLKKHIWNEIIDYDPNSCSYDRLRHVSTYTLTTSGIERKSMNIEEDTNIVIGE